MPDYRRNRIPGGTYFFTVNLLERGSSLLVAHLHDLRDAVRTVRARRPFHIDAWVVLPDHMHVVWTLPDDDTDYSGRWKAIKIAFAKALPKTERLSAVRAAKGERGIWQRRFWEHTIRDEQDYVAHVDYVHINPLKHGLVTSVKDWPHSSFQRCVARGIYAPDWAGQGVEDLCAGERGG
ncbi:MAG: yafMH [bacterium]|nr:MAG: yafMH [bacterium]KAF0146957.1 MAG: yafMH [bacterium]KAF0163874.1 MAG: yafMH [bacterium]TXT16153.1 MAG: yafMH [bacterium]